MKNRDMFYENYSTGGYNGPINQNMLGPNMGYNPNMINPNYMQNNPNMINEQMGYNYDNNHEQRITRLEKIIRNLDTRIQKLEGTIVDTDDNIYMI